MKLQANYDIVWAASEIWIWRKGQYETQVAVAEPPAELEAIKYVRAAHAMALAARLVDMDTAIRDLIDSADLTCMRETEEISVAEGCPCAVCVVQRSVNRPYP